MAEKYLLNLTQEQYGYNDLHKASCIYVPGTNYEEIGGFYAPSSAVVAAKLKHPFKKIKGCVYNKRSEVGGLKSEEGVGGRS